MELQNVIFISEVLSKIMKNRLKFLKICMWKKMIIIP